MGYWDQNGQLSGTDDIVVVPSATIAVTTNGAAIDVRHGTVALTLDVTAIVGTPTLDVAIQTRKDASDAWRAIASFAQATAVSSERKCFAGCDRQIRAVSTFGSTTSITFSISGDAR